MCFVWISEQTAIISLYSINWLVFITKKECVYCAVRAQSLTVIQVNLRRVNPLDVRNKNEKAHGACCTFSKFVHKKISLPWTLSNFHSRWQHRCFGIFRVKWSLKWCIVIENWSGWTDLSNIHRYHILCLFHQQCSSYFWLTDGRTKLSY